MTAKIGAFLLRSTVVTTLLFVISASAVGTVIISIESFIWLLGNSPFAVLVGLLFSASAIAGIGAGVVGASSQ